MMNVMNVHDECALLYSQVAVLAFSITLADGLNLSHG